MDFVGYCSWLYAGNRKVIGYPRYNRVETEFYSFLQPHVSTHPRKVEPIFLGNGIPSVVSQLTPVFTLDIELKNPEDGRAKSMGITVLENDTSFSFIVTNY